MADDHRPRRLSGVVAQRLTEEPVVILTGPRTVGKSTLLAELARGGDRFTGGFVLNLGDLAYRKEDRISVLPLCRLWS